ncbi:MAG: prepilin-type N-terminal cleavage/methylation domain-containing protein [Gemmatimonadaceae bacterium]|nr:prepilin-type N-terminal cleavage/methylation domain-containing protein [Gemmatimonadaceae bacterium]
MRRRQGFSIIELLVTMTVIGLLTQIAVPRYSDMKRRATAASILGDVHAIRIAAFTHYTEAGSFPPASPAGQAPAQLVQYLPSGFTFTRADYSYTWHSWPMTVGGRTETLVGVTVTVSDPRLATQLVRSAGAGFIPIVTATSVTFLVSTS